VFDDRFKTVIRCKSPLGYLEMLDWVNKNSNGSVQTKFVEGADEVVFYFGFEDKDDALLFKIKYSM